MRRSRAGDPPKETWRQRLVGIGCMAAFVLAAGLLEKGCDQVQQRVGPDSRSMEEILQDDDIEVLEKRLRKGTDPNAKDAVGHGIIHWARSPRAREILLRNGADPEARDHYGDTALMAAVREGDAESVKVLLAAGADVHAVNTQYGIDHTAMANAISRRDQEIIDLLEAAGAHDDRVTAANGLPLPADGGPPFRVCAEYIAAIHHRDLAAMVPLVTWEMQATDDGSTDWDTLSSVRPSEPRFDGGYYNQTDATLTLSGLTPKGFEAVWSFQLRRLRAEQAATTPEAKPGIEPLEAGMWRILREDWIVD